jgi:hypothetical protein
VDQKQIVRDLLAKANKYRSFARTSEPLGPGWMRANIMRP